MPKLEFTGERMVPGQVDPDLELEHVSRYHFAARHVTDQEVLDLACGAGYGSAILAAAGARRVVGVDLAVQAVEYSRSTVAAGAGFVAADGLRLPFARERFDRIVAFEVLEHVAEPEALLREAARVLRPGGLLIISTPEREAYRESREGVPNPFHVRELSLVELRDLLTRTFESHRLFAQTRAEGALFSPLGGQEPAAGQLAGVEEPPRPAFCLAICGAAAAVERARLQSYFHPGSLDSVRRRDRRIRELQAEVEDRSAWAQAASQEVESKSRRVVELQAELEERRQWARDLEAEAESKAKLASSLGEQLEERTRRARELEAQVRAAQTQTELLGERARVEREHAEERWRWEASSRQEREQSTRRFAAVDERLDALRRRADELATDAAKAHRADVDRSERSLRELRSALDELTRTFGATAEQLQWQGDSLGLHRQDLDRMGERLAPLREEVARLTQAEYSHGRALEHLAEQVSLLRDRAELAEIGQRHLEQLAGENQAGLEHTHDLMAQIWRSAAWTWYQKVALKSNRLWRWPRARFGGTRAAWRRYREARAERHRAETRLAAELEARSIVVPRTSPPRLEVVLAAESGDDTVACLDSLTSAPVQVPYRITLLVSDPWFPVAPFRRLPGLGVLRARQPDSLRELERIAKRSRCDRIVFLDARARPAADCLDRLAASFRDLEGAGIVGARVVDSQGHLVEQGCAVSRDGRPLLCRPNQLDAGAGWAREVDCCGPLCFAIDGGLLNAVGGLREGQGGLWHRCADLGFRVRAAGRRVYVQPTAVVRIDGPPPAPAEPREDVLLRQAWHLEIDQRPAATDGQELLAALDSRPRFLVVDHRLPTPDQDSGSLRMSHLLKLMGELGYRVTFVPDNLQRIDPYALDLEAIGVEIVTAPERRTVDEYLRETGDCFEIVLVSRAHIAERHLTAVRASCPSARVVFDTVDLQFLRLRRQAEVEGDGELGRAADKVKSRELALVGAADLTLVVSSVEQGLLEAEAPGMPVRVLSNIHRVHGGRTGFDERTGLLFIGGFEHPPNVDAVIWLVREILPRVHVTLPHLHLSIVGSKPTGEVRALGSKSVTIAGYVPDVTPYFERCRLTVAPLRYGAGVKGKVNQSLAHGVPCVATSCAAEGMGLVTGVDILIADDAETFAAAIVRAHSDPVLWQRLSEGGLRNTRERFSIAAARRDLEAILEELNRRRPHRDETPSGAVLAFPPGARRPSA